MDTSPGVPKSTNRLLPTDLSCPAEAARNLILRRILLRRGYIAVRRRWRPASKGRVHKKTVKNHSKGTWWIGSLILTVKVVTLSPFLSPVLIPAAYRVLLNAGDVSISSITWNRKYSKFYIPLSCCVAIQGQFLCNVATTHSKVTLKCKANENIMQI
jgi:hypothetical protein